MASAKDLIVKPITAQDARRLVKRIHYSGKVVNNSSLHFGVFWKGKCEGAMQFGPSLDKSKVQGLVSGSGWNEFLELNRMAFSDNLPRNSESRALSVAFRLIRIHYPHIKWIISFADGAQCGDGAIYRASGFLLTGLNKSKNIVKMGNGNVIHKMTLESNPTKPREELGGKSYYDVTGGKYDFGRYCDYVDGVVIVGYQLRYIYFIDKSYKDRLTVPVLPFSKIRDMDAGMYKGKKTVRLKQAMADQQHSGGVAPT